MGQMPIIDLSTRRGIDWTEPQSPGTYRCVEGWDSDGFQYGCLLRATTETDDGDLRCTEHAHLYELRKLREATERETEAANASFEDVNDYLETVGQALWDINYTLMPMYRKIYYRVRGWFYTLRDKRRSRNHPYQSEEDKVAFEEARHAVQMWLKYPTPSNADRAAIALVPVETRSFDPNAAEMDDKQAYIEGHDMFGPPDSDK